MNVWSLPIEFGEQLMPEIEKNYCPLGKWILPFREGWIWPMERKLEDMMRGGLKVRGKQWCGNVAEAVGKTVSVLNGKKR